MPAIRINPTGQCSAALSRVAAPTSMVSARVSCGLLLNFFSRKLIDSCSLLPAAVAL